MNGNADEERLEKLRNEHARAGERKEQYRVKIETERQRKDASRTSARFRIRNGMPSTHKSLLSTPSSSIG